MAYVGSACVCHRQRVSSVQRVFHARLRVVAHLERGAQASQRALREGRLPAFPEVDLKEADAADAAVCRAARAAGT